MKTELYREYDGLVGLTMLNLRTLSKNDEAIELGDFDRKNKEHLFMLKIALLTRAIHDIPVYIQCSYFDWIIINLFHCKGFARVKRIGKVFFTNIDTQEVLDFMRGDGIERCGENFSFGDIYKEYYERS